MFKHYILTRFNKIDDNTDVYNYVDDPDEWMRHRCDLFNSYCLPAMIMQTCKNFTWLLAFSEKTPRKYIEFYEKFRFIRIIYEYPKTYVQNLYGTELKDGDWLITSRLDNDDYYHRTFIERVQGEFDHSFKLVDSEGQQLDLATGQFYSTARSSNNSPFISLIEQVGTPYKSPEKPFYDSPIRTVMYCSHSNMTLHFPSIRIDETLYTMVIHDRNVSNHIVGDPIPGRKFRE